MSRVDKSEARHSPRESVCLKERRLQMRASGQKTRNSGVKPGRYKTKTTRPSAATLLWRGRGASQPKKSLMERRLTIIQGDLTLLPLRQGGIINPSNTGMVLTSRGLNQQIARRAGPFIQQALHIARSKLRGGRLEPGQVLETEAGQLPVKHLIHVSLVGGRKINKRLISRGLLSALDRADELELKQIGLPPLGPGTSKFPIEDFMEIFWRIIAEEFPTTEHIREIYLCLDNKQEFDYVCQYAEEHADEMPEEIELAISEDGVGLGIFAAHLNS